MAFPVVIGPGGQRYELHEGMKQNFLSLYGEWENGTIMCPPLFPRDLSVQSAAFLVAYSRLRDGGGKSFSNKKCEKRPLYQAVRVLFSLCSF